jgi:hypothetical protein
MSFDVNQIGVASPTSALGPAMLTRPAAGGFAAVHDLAAKREAAQRPDIPNDVWDEVDAASRIATDIEHSGHWLRFDRRLDGRIVAKLCDTEGAVVRRMSLSEVIDLGSQDPDDAA